MTATETYDEAMRHGKYRIRTAMRGRMPWALVGLFPKGHGDCGDHEWYRSTDDIDRCYHCEAGVRVHTAPLGPYETADELLATLRAAGDDAITVDDLITTRGESRSWR